MVETRPTITQYIGQEEVPDLSANMYKGVGSGDPTPPFCVGSTPPSAGPPTYGSTIIRLIVKFEIASSSCGLLAMTYIITASSLRGFLFREHVIAERDRKKQVDEHHAPAEGVHSS